MPPRITDKSEIRTTAGRPRRIGRPRGATAASRIYADLRTELVSLERRPGDVVSEAEIALSYGVSRTPVREAILKLSDEGLLEIFPQSGIIVSRIPVAALPEAIIIRKALEETTARLAAERATSSQLLGLRATLERQREAEASKSAEAFHQADEAFHGMIAEIAGHPGIWKLIQQVKVHVDRYRRLTLPQKGRIALARSRHESSVTGIGPRTPERAAAAMNQHLERLRANIDATQSINPEFFDERG